MKKLPHIGALALLFLVLTILLYWESRYAGMVMDYTGWIEKFEGKPWTDVFVCFGFPANQQVAIAFLYLMVEIVGQHELIWSLIYWIFHAVNALLLYLLLKDLFVIFQLKYAEWRSFVCALLWLCCCYHGEVVIWKVTQNYFVLAFFNLLMLRDYLRFFLSGLSKYYWRATALFIIALFTFEQALVNIAMVLLLMGALIAAGKIAFDKKVMMRITLPMLMSIGVYFLVSFLWIGDWVGHYGSEAHLSFDIKLILANYARYFLKYIAYWRFYDYSSKEFLFHWMGNWSWLILLILGALMLLVLRKLKSRSLIVLTVLMAVFTVLMFLPVSNLHMVWEGVSSGERYTYFASMFYFPLIILMLSPLLETVQLFTAIGLLVVNVSLLSPTTDAWKNNQYIYRNLVDAYRWEEEELVLFLNSPDNFNNTFLFIDKDQHGFEDALIYYGKKNIAGEVYDVVQYNMFTINDGVSVKKVGEDEFIVEFNQWGNWWFHNGIGAPKKIDAPYYTLEIEEWYYYRIKLKPNAKDAVLIYQDGPELKEFKR